MVFTLLFTAGLTLHTEDSEAARRQQVRKASGQKKRVVRNKRGAGIKKRSLPRVSVRSTPSGVFALYQNPLFGYGKCLPGLVEPAKEVLSRNGIKTEKASTTEVAALAKGIAQVERLLGKPIPNDYQYDYQWKEASGAWNSGISRPGFVTVKRPRGSPKGTLTGRMMHELGHRFGHANGNQNYQEYRDHMRRASVTGSQIAAGGGRKCMITRYCGKSLNEEFAEVFEAYVVNPDFLAKHCPDSYAYFKHKLFRNPEALNVSCEDPDSVLDHDTDDDEAAEESNEQQIDEDNEFELPAVGPVPMANPRTQEEAVTTTPAAETTVDDKSTLQQQVPVVTQEQVVTQDTTQQQAPASEEKAAVVEPVKTETRNFQQFTLPGGSKIPVPTIESQK